MMTTTDFIELEIPIGHMQSLLESFDIEVDSPDGWVPVTHFVDKGEEKEYILELADHSERLRMSGKHLVETENGWMYAEDLQGFYEENTVNVLTKNGLVPAYVFSTGRTIPIVDITVDHENHRYYTNGISSHNSGGGKSLVMSHMAAGCLRDGLNVLYISMEMSEEKIAERIDANLLDVEVDKIKDLGKDIFCTKISNLAAKTHGRLFIKEYPSGTAHTGHFRGLLEELKTKQDFVSDIIFVDYLGICASSRVKMGGSVNSYAYLKSVAEELRAFATENDVPIVTAGQVNRGGYNTSDLDMTDISESLGIVMTADIILGIVRTEELDNMGQVMFVQMKNRYSDPTVNKRFTVGLNRAKMKLYDLEGMANSSFASAVANKTYASKLAQKPQEETLVSEDVIESLPIAGIKPKTINTDGFSF